MRYDNREIFINRTSIYKKYFDERGVERMVQYRTPVMPQPTVAQEEDFNSIAHVWKLRDRFFKLADRYYKDPSLWWILAWYNQKPTEYHVLPGSTFWIPMPLERALFVFGA